jgi:membrane protein
MAQTDEANAAQVGRGREAEAPTEIPLPGWKDVLWRIYRAIVEDRVLLTAACATFYILLAMVPSQRR